MIVVDSSAVIAILFGEPSADRLMVRLAADPDRVISAASYLEADLDAFLIEAGIEVAQVDAEQARLALSARITYGRGMGHGGVLNFGDTFSYALAKSLDAPLLFVGDDFKTTDVSAAM